MSAQNSQWTAISALNPEYGRWPTVIMHSAKVDLHCYGRRILNILQSFQQSTPYFIPCMKSTACAEAITSSLTYSVLVFSIPRRWNQSGQYLLERSLVCNLLKSKKLAVLSVCMVKVYLQKDFEYLILMLHHNRFQVYSRFNILLRIQSHFFELLMYA